MASLPSKIFGRIRVQPDFFFSKYINACNISGPLLPSNNRRIFKLESHVRLCLLLRPVPIFLTKAYVVPPSDWGFYGEDPFESRQTDPMERLKTDHVSTLYSVCTHGKRRKQSTKIGEVKERKLITITRPSEYLLYLRGQRPIPYTLKESQALQ